MEVGFLLVWLGLLGAPVLAAIIAILTRRQGSPKRSAIVAGSALLLYFAVACSGLSFVVPWVNLACFVAAYFAYCFLAMVCLRIQARLVRIPSFLVAIVPIGVGYLLSTIGILGLMFIVGDYTRLPDRVEQMATGLDCRVTGWGAVGTASGYVVGLYQSWSGIPFLERRVSSRSVTQVGYLGPEPEGASCSGVWAEYMKG
jgi:hypothetical protein